MSDPSDREYMKEWFIKYFRRHGMALPPPTATLEDYSRIYKELVFAARNNDDDSDAPEKLMSDERDTDDGEEAVGSPSRHSRGSSEQPTPGCAGGPRLDQTLYTPVTTQKDSLKNKMRPRRTIFREGEGKQPDEFPGTSDDSNFPKRTLRRSPSCKSFSPYIPKVAMGLKKETSGSKLKQVSATKKQGGRMSSCKRPIIYLLLMILVAAMCFLLYTFGVYWTGMWWV